MWTRVGNKRRLALLISVLAAVIVVTAGSVGLLDGRTAVVLVAQVAVLGALAVIYAHARALDRKLERTERRLRHGLRSVTGGGTAGHGAVEVVSGARPPQPEDPFLRDELAALKHSLLGSIAEQRVEWALREEAEARRHGEMYEAQDRLERSLSRCEAAIGTSGSVAAQFQRLVRDQQVHAELARVLAPPLPIAPLSGPAADAVVTAVTQVLVRRPELVVDCGAGTSTLWLAYALERVGVQGRVVALTGDRRCAQRTDRLLDSHRLTHRVDVRYAPSQPHFADGEAAPWFDSSAWGDLDRIDVALFHEAASFRSGDLRRAVALLTPRSTAEAVFVVQSDRTVPAGEDVDKWFAAHGLCRDSSVSCSLVLTRSGS